MKKIVASILIFFSIVTHLNAQSLKDLEIEGISVGDSLLNFTSVDYIKNNFGKWYDDEYHQLILEQQNSNQVPTIESV